MNTDKPSCSDLFPLLNTFGVSDVVISPGSRNTPIIIAAEACSRIKKTVVIDERVAAFIALGMSVASGRPVALVCTSGTALLNYAPAVAEAYYRGIPLIVISADRPRQWIDQDDSQTLRQFEALQNFVKKSYDIPDFSPADKEMKWYANRTINDALITATQRRKGPVHINIQLNNPLNGISDTNISFRKIDLIQSNGSIHPVELEALADKAYGKKILIVAGFMTPDHKLSESLRKIASLPNVFILAETLSNIHVDKACYRIDGVISSLNQAELKELAPDIVITIGGALVSRFIKQYLRTLPDISHWSVGYSHTTVDCFMALSKRISCNPVIFFRKLTGALRKNPCKSDYGDKWRFYVARAEEAANEIIDKTEWSDLTVFHKIISSLPDGINLHLSNGTPVRYAQIFPNRRIHASYCNRGVSGIDGCTSTAIGAAKVSSKPTLLITGDMSMSYDISALFIHDIPDNFKIICMDNSGGDIFRFIPTTSTLPTEMIEKYFCIPPNLSLSKLADASGFRYFYSDSYKTIDGVFKNFIDNESKSILHIKTNPENNAVILKKFLHL